MTGAERAAQEAWIVGHADGCILHPACLTCPRPQCVWEDPAAERRAAQEAHLALVGRYAHAHGKEAAQREYGVSQRTAYRALQSIRRLA